jgi:hypothetical protein
MQRPHTLGTQFTCFTGTKVQILTHKAHVRRCLFAHCRARGARGARLEGTQFYLLYWYKSTNTDAQGEQACDVPDLVDIKLLLASRAFDDDWLMRPRLQLQVALEVQ